MIRTPAKHSISWLPQNLALWLALKKKLSSKRARRAPKTVLRLADLDHAKAAVQNLPRTEAVRSDHDQPPLGRCPQGRVRGCRFRTAPSRTGGRNSESKW